MKNISKSILLAAFITAITMTSCQDFLDQEPKSFLSETNTYSTVLDGVIAVSGIYDALGYRDENFGWGLYAGSMIPMDILNGVSTAYGANDKFVGITRATHTADNRVIRDVYYVSYFAIQRANDVIANLPRITGSQEKVDGLMAEARFLRALLYFNLVRYWGEVPLMLDPILSIDQAFIGHADAKDIYAAIIEDLEFASEFGYYKAGSGLEPSYDQNDLGRATRGAANGLLAKVYLTIASYNKHTSIATYNKNNIYGEDWVDQIGAFEKAVEYSQKVIDSNVYDLEDDYVDVFRNSNENGLESLFEVQFLPLTEAIGEAGLQGGWQEGYKRSGAVNQFVDSYDPADLRLANNITPGKKANEPVITKFDFDTNRGDTNFNSGVNAMVLRYADVLLINAEAKNELGIQDFFHLNNIRRRAGLADLVGPLSIRAYREAIWQERKWELCFELHDWCDAVRTGTLLSDVRALKEYSEEGEITTLPTEGANNILPKHRLFPFPQGEVDKNTLLFQNPGF